MPIQHIIELFALDGHAFVTEAYRNLLKREPDEHGMAYYLGRLAQGYGKAAVIAQLAKSLECRPLDEIQGLKKLIAEEHRAQHWFWGFFGHRKRVEKILRSGIEEFSRVDYRLHSLQTVAESLTNSGEHLARIVDQFQSLNVTILQLARQIGNISIQATANHQTQDEDTTRLPSEMVRQYFVDILGREPENAEIIKHHANLPSAEALREALINSKEFQSKIRTLPEHASVIFKRQIQQKITLQGV